MLRLCTDRVRAAMVRGNAVAAVLAAAATEAQSDWKSTVPDEPDRAPSASTVDDFRCLSGEIVEHPIEIGG